MADDDGGGRGGDGHGHGTFLLPVLYAQHASGPASDHRYRSRARYPATPTARASRARRDSLIGATTYAYPQAPTAVSTTPPPKSHRTGRAPGPSLSLSEERLPCQPPRYRGRG